jgi:hypothetical protein
MFRFIIRGMLVLENDVKKYENDIKNLCNDMIYLLDKLKFKGLIDNDEYEKNIYEKKKFLDKNS